MVGENVEGQAVTVEVCEKFHQDICSRLAAHDKRAEGIELQVQIISKAQACQAEALAAQAASQVKQTESQEKTQAHLETTAQELGEAVKVIKASADVQKWLMTEVTAGRKAMTSTTRTISKENLKLIGIISSVVGTLGFLLMAAFKLGVI